jgi:restriction system protein
MNDDLPKFHETFIPMLSVLSSGEELHYQELRRRVRDQFFSDLPAESLALQTKKGEPLILDRIGWAKAWLKQGKFVEQPRRAYVQITAKGKEVLRKGNLSLSDLKRDPDFVDAEVRKNQAKLAEESEPVFENFSPQDLIDQGFSAIEKEIKADLLDRVKEIDPFYFEKVILILLKKMGYGDFVETSKSGDGGVDGIINQDQLGLSKIYIQAKRYAENKVREKEIRNFIGAMSGDTTNGVFVTTSSFGESAIAKAKEAHHKIILIDGRKLVDLMYEFEVGVQVISNYQVKEPDDEFFEST